MKEKAENLALLGYLHNILQKYLVELPNAGMVRKSLIAYVREQLSDYYTLIANIQTQVSASQTHFYVIFFITLQHYRSIYLSRCSQPQPLPQPFCL